MGSNSSSGHCLCGHVQIQTTGEQEWVCHCHCSSCRRHSGAPVATFVSYRKDQVTFTSGKPKAFESSPGVFRSFCPECGTPISYEGPMVPNDIHLYVGVMSEPEKFVPGAHVFYSEHLPWLNIEDECPRFETLPPTE